MNTVTRFENSGKAQKSTIKCLKHALESAGVVFVEPNGLGAGVRLKDGGERP